MKQGIFLLSILFCQLVAFGQQETSVKTKLVFQVPTGQASDSVSIRLWNVAELVDTYLSSAKSVNGQATFDLPSDRNFIIDFSIGSKLSAINNIWIEPGDSLFLKLPDIVPQFNYFEVEVTGKGSEKFVFMKEFERLEKLRLKSPVFQKLTVVDVTRINLQSMDSLHNLHKSGIDDHIFKLFKLHYLSKIDNSFLGYRTEIDSAYAQEFKRYEKLFPASRMIENGKLLLRLPEQHLLFRAAMDYYIKNNMEQEYDWKIIGDIEKMPSIITNYYQSKPLRDFVMVMFFEQRLKAKGPTEALVTAATKYLKNEDNGGKEFDNLKQTLSNAILNQKSGTTAYPFSLMDKNGKTIKQSDFKGKLVLLDFNFFGCIPCQSVGEALARLEDNYEGKDIIFISISIDNSFDVFKKAIGKYNSPKSLHLYTNGKGYNHEIIKHYGIMSYPTLVLIDKEGKLISRNIPRPDIAETEFLKMIDSALEK